MATPKEKLMKLLNPTGGRGGNTAASRKIDWSGTPSEDTVMGRLAKSSGGKDIFDKIEENKPRYRKPAAEAPSKSSKSSEPSEESPKSSSSSSSSSSGKSFSQAFREARAAGKDTFTWNGKKYTTEMAGEKKRAEEPEPKAERETTEYDFGTTNPSEFKRGGKVKKYAKGGSVSSRADGCAQRGKTRGRMI